MLKVVILDFKVYIYIIHDTIKLVNTLDKIVYL